MNIDVVLTPTEIDGLPERDLRETTAVVFDVLRATSTMLTALAHGAREIHPARTIEEALVLKKKMPDALLGGERHGERIDGFDLGNSPLEYRGPLPPRIITTTTNGTVALRACGHAREVLAAAFLNMEALLGHLRRGGAGGEVLLVCAGTFREAALEDVLAAGMVCARIPGAALSDAARMARAVFSEYAEDIFAGLCAAKNGRVLLQKGREEEVRWCAQVSHLPVVAALGAGALRRVETVASTPGGI